MSIAIIRDITSAVAAKGEVAVDVEAHIAIAIAYGSSGSVFHH